MNNHNLMSVLSNYEFDREALEALPDETPFFVISKKKILSNYHRFQENFKEASIQYALKANSELGVLKILDKAGSGFEAASIYEFNILKKAGVSPSKVIYGTSVKPVQHIKEFFEQGVDRFAFDTFPELEKIASVAPGARVYVRVVVNDTGSVFRFSEKFGTDKSNAVSLLQRAKELGLVPYGISFHVGSQASNPMAWANAIKALSPILTELKDLDIDIEVINIGGGYPCNYDSAEEQISLEEIAENFYKEYKKLPYQPKLILEPGRAIIASAAILVASIIARVERPANTWLFLDAGVYNALYETMAYQGSTRYHVSSMRPSYNAGEGIFALAGPTGDSADVITREAHLPKDLNVGDKLIFHDVGAYSLVTASPFNGFPKPDVHIV